MASRTLLSYLVTNYSAQFGHVPEVDAFVAWAENTLAENVPVGTGFADDSGAITVRLQSGDQYALCRALDSSAKPATSVQITGQSDRKGGIVPATDIPITGG